jgi:hypothetical protein
MLSIYLELWHIKLCLLTAHFPEILIFLPLNRIIPYYFGLGLSICTWLQPFFTVTGTNFSWNERLANLCYKSSIMNFVGGKTMSVASSKTLMFLSLKYSQWREVCCVDWNMSQWMAFSVTLHRWRIFLYIMRVRFLAFLEACKIFVTVAGLLLLLCLFYPALSITFQFHGVRIWWKRNLCIEHTLLPTILLILMHVKHTIPYLCIQPSSWRWTLGFETFRRRKENEKFIY